MVPRALPHSRLSDRILNGTVAQMLCHVGHILQNTVLPRLWKRHGRGAYALGNQTEKNSNDDGYVACISRRTGGRQYVKTETKREVTK